ncbi:hypothetical protein HaLaN_15270 [Haematococcus lacustris]|uniref:Uncharacterized protein n=1 Tax=Haematococcus lacustris TaxID=44745 RepID=A0A699ZIF1_HAELA|nr:hypothetical protein HaLaN_15270 [Haematococcus lacustris]
MVLLASAMCCFNASDAQGHCALLPPMDESDLSLASRQLHTPPCTQHALPPILAACTACGLPGKYPVLDTVEDQLICPRILPRKAALPGNIPVQVAGAGRGNATGGHNGGHRGCHTVCLAGLSR